MTAGSHPRQGELRDRNPWPPERIAKLRKFWDEGLSGSQIGERLGTTKNAVIGEAHRLGLPRRPSPIRAKSDQTEGVPRQATATGENGVNRRAIKGPTLSPIASCERRPESPDGRSDGECDAGTSAVGVGASPAHALGPSSRGTGWFSPPAYVYVPPRSSPCSWPIGEPGTRTFRYCDAPSERGRPYCADHCAVAYLRIRDRREDHARA